jgi:hypothetical protein
MSSNFNPGYPLRSSCPSNCLLTADPHHIFVGLLFPSLCSALLCTVCSKLSSRRDISSTNPHCQPTLPLRLEKHTLSKNLTRHPSKFIRQRIQQLVDDGGEFGGRGGICRCLVRKYQHSFGLSVGKGRGKGENYGLCR